MIPRGRNPRIIRCEPSQYYFKPRGVPLVDLPDEVKISIEELEAMRLADLMGKSQREAADAMNISQPTISRHLESVHRKIAKALLLGLGIRIANPSDFIHCEQCGYITPVVDRSIIYKTCENCNSTQIHFHIHSNNEHRIQSVSSINETKDSEK